MITNERFKELIEKYYGNMTPDDDYCDILEEVRKEIAKEIKKDYFCLDFASYNESETEVIDFVLQACYGNKVKDWVVYHSESLDMTFYAIEYEETEPDYFLKKIKDTIENIQKEINGLSFVDAGKKLGGFNADNELFDFNYGLDNEYYINGTIYNKNGKAFIDLENSYFDIYREDSPKNVLKITYNEITEQLKRVD